MSEVFVGAKSAAALLFSTASLYAMVFYKPLIMTLVNRLNALTIQQPELVCPLNHFLLCSDTP